MANPVVDAILRQQYPIDGKYRDLDDQASLEKLPMLNRELELACRYEEAAEDWRYVQIRRRAGPSKETIDPPQAIQIPASRDPSAAAEWQDLEAKLGQVSGIANQLVKHFGLDRYWGDPRPHRSPQSTRSPRNTIEESRLENSDEQLGNADDQSRDELLSLVKGLVASFNEVKEQMSRLQTQLSGPATSTSQDHRSATSGSDLADNSPQSEDGLRWPGHNPTLRPTRPDLPHEQDLPDRTGNSLLDPKRPNRSVADQTSVSRSSDGCPPASPLPELGEADMECLAGAVNSEIEAVRECGDLCREERQGELVEDGDGNEDEEEDAHEMEVVDDAPQWKKRKKPTESGIPETDAAGANLGSPRQLPGPARGPKFSLEVEEMGEKMTQSIANIIANDKFAGKILIKNLRVVNWEELAERIKPPEPEDDEDELFATLAVEYCRGGKGFSNLLQSESKTFKFPDFSTTVQEPSQAEIQSYLCRQVDNPPKGPIPYYIGPQLTTDPPLTTDIDSLLHPGDEIGRIGDGNVPGVNSLYWHAGEKYSGTAFHCEDANLRSCNLTLYGWKLWIMIRENHNEKFEAFIKRHWTRGPCDQYIRHHNLLISPARLEEEGIAFDIHCAGPGDMIVTAPRQYHAVINMTNCFAISINFLLPDELAISETVAVCPECGLYSLEHKNIKKIDDNPQPGRDLLARGGKPGSRRKTKATRIEQLDSAKELKEIEQQIRKADKRCKIPSFDTENPPGPDILKLVAAIWSRLAIDQFRSLVRSRRDLDTERIRFSGSDNLQTRIKGRLRSINISTSISSLDNLLIRYQQFSLARDIEESRQGCLRADSKVLNAIRGELGWEKKTFNYHYEVGKKWRRVCGQYDGLLCFIFLDGKNKFGISPTSYLAMNEEDRLAFHNLLDLNIAYTCLDKAGRAFQDSLDGTVEDVEFKWEGRNASKDVLLDNLSEEKLLSYLEPFPAPRENLYNPDKYPCWPKPSDWPVDWQWPTDPTSIPKSDKTQCDLCTQMTCNCINSLHKFKPRIKDYGEKGRGLQAVASIAGERAYKKGDIIGHLTGELVPLGTCDDDRALDLVRGDIPGEPLVCQIHCAEIGNSFRLLNHSCKASATAQLRGLRVSGKYTVTVEAIVDIYDGVEITVDYGGRREMLY